MTCPKTHLRSDNYLMRHSRYRFMKIRSHSYEIVNDHRLKIGFPNLVPVRLPDYRFIKSGISLPS